MHKKILPILKKELYGYFVTPIAYVFIVIFLVLSSLFTFKVSGFYERGQADLIPFFFWHPWLYLILLPALSMRLWAEEKKAGTIELLLTLPVQVSSVVIGKFLASWLFSGIALLLTFPIALTVIYLGNPDMGAIVAGYTGSFLLAGAYLAIGSVFSSLSKNQVVSFILTVVVCLGFNLIGYYPFVSFLSGIIPAFLVESLSNFSFTSHFTSIQRGVVEFKDLIFFASIIIIFLSINSAIIEDKKGS